MKINHKVMRFDRYLGLNPTLYDGVNLDAGTIDFLNNHFRKYNVNVDEFEPDYVQRIRKAAGIYNNLKAIELQEQIFDITTNATVRNIATNTLENLKSKVDGTLDSTTTGGYTDKKGGSDTESNSIGKGNVRTLTKQIPMTSDGNEFDDYFEWDSGATSAVEVENDISGGRTLNYGGDTTRTYNSMKVSQDDNRVLKKLGTTDTTSGETLKAVNGQVVNLVQNIWNYLIGSKSIDYLVEELEGAFILCY